MIQKLGKYVIVEKLGEGAMGAVYKGYDEVLDRYVAIKTMVEDIQWSAELKLRFYREARSAASLHHPNIVIIHDMGEEGKIAYIVMEFLDGKDLKDLIKDKTPLTMEQKISICAQVCEGLNHAHLAGIIHRDIKPGNIYFSSTGTVKIVDFGIAHIPSSDLTQSGVRLGTPIYMSPEQIRGEPYDDHSDMFSAGIVFYELMTYVHPFRDKNVTKTLDNILFQNHFPFAEQCPQAPAGLWPILRTCLEKEAGKRYQTMAEAGRAFRTLLVDLEAASLKMAGELSQAKMEADQQAEEQKQARNAVLLEETRRNLAARQFPAAIEALNEILQSDAGHAEAAELRHQALTEAEAERAQAARKAAEIANQQAEEQKRARNAALLEEARRNLAARRFPAAIEALNKILQSDTGHAEAVELRHQALTEAEAERAQIARKAAEIANLLEQGRAALQQREFDAAGTHARKVLELDPDNASANELLKSIDLAREAKRKQDQIDGDLARGREALERQDFAVATACGNSVLAIDPENSAARNLLLTIRQAEERKLREEKIGNLLAQGQQALQQDALTEAGQFARRALEVDPQHARAKEFLTAVDEARQRRRKAEIQDLVARGTQALGHGEFAEATELGQRALVLDTENAEARNLLAVVAQAKKNLQQEQIDAALECGRNALARGDFDEADRQAQIVRNLEAKNQAAGNLLKEIKQKRKDQAKLEASEKKRLEKEARIREKEQKISAAAENMSATVVLAPPGSAGKGMGRGGWKIILWICVAAAIVVGSVVLVRYYRNSRRPADVRTQLSSAQASFDRGLYDEAIAAAQSVLDTAPGNTQALALIETAQKQKAQKEISTLLMEAQSLRSQGKLEESRSILDKLLSIDPANEAALSVRAQIESESAATKSGAEQDAAAQSWLANAGKLLAAGKLAEAKAELDKVARIRPDIPELKALRKQLASRSEEMARLDKLDKQKLDADQKQKLVEELGSQAEILFEQAKYSEAAKAIDQWLASAPQNTRAQTLQRQTQQALQGLKAFETHFAGRQYDEALAAVAQLEKINPKDSQIGELRRRVEERKAAASATLSIYRMGRPGKLILDGAPVGADGELENKSIGIGRHKLEIENSAGKQAGSNLDLTEGQTAAYVYDSATLELRPMADTDRALLAKRKTQEQIHSYEVEHRHILGKCNGTLLISGFSVEYRASDKSHSFDKPLSSLKLSFKAGEDKIEMQQVTGASGSSWTFKVRNPAQAAEIKELWDRLQKLIK
jgi:tetratricopeptide (TPR) repeat protein